MTGRQGGSLDPKKLIIASLVEGVCVLAGILMFFRTDNLLWLLGGVVVGSVPVLWLIFTAARSRGAAGTGAADSGGSIVEDARGRR